MVMTKNRVFASHALSDHEKKNFSILELIRRNGPITRADISKTTDLNIVTVSNYINTYISEGLVVEGGMEASSGGRKPTLVKLRENHGYAIGLDLGHVGEIGSHMIGIVTDLSGRIIARVDKARERDTMDKIIDKSLSLISELMSKKGVSKDKIKGVGIAVGGVSFFSTSKFIRLEFAAKHWEIFLVLPIYARPGLLDRSHSRPFYHRSVSQCTYQILGLN